MNFSHLRACFLIVLFSLGWTTQARAEMGGPPLNVYISIEELEYGFNNDENPISLDSASWIGGDWHRIWLKVEGESSTVALEIDGEVQLLYSHLIAPFWELQFGVRGDLSSSAESTSGRGHLVLGLEGMAPFRFEVEPAFFMSYLGDISFRLVASYDIFLTQRLMLHPSFELNAALQSVPEFQVGAGLNDLDFGLRLGYQIRREIMPYAGVSFNRAFGERARFQEKAGGTTDDLQAVAGLRFWF